MSVHSDQSVRKSGQNLEDADRAVIMVHGRGATAESLLQLSEHLPKAAYLAPQAANRTWYPHSFLQPVEKNQPHLDSALEKLDELVERCASTVGKDNVFLLGFSQGACLASEYAARNLDRYGGVIAFSGGLIGEEIGDFPGDIEETPVFIGCAENDPHIPKKRVDETEEVFEKLGAEVDKYIFEGSHHGIVDYEIEKASEMIRK